MYGCADGGCAAHGCAWPERGGGDRVGGGLGAVCRGAERAKERGSEILTNIHAAR